MLYTDQPIRTGFSDGTNLVTSTVTAAPFVYKLLQVFYTHFPQYENQVMSLPSYRGVITARSLPPTSSPKTLLSPPRLSNPTGSLRYQEWLVRSHLARKSVSRLQLQQLVQVPHYPGPAHLLPKCLQNQVSPRIGQLSRCDRHQFGL